MVERIEKTSEKTRFQKLTDDLNNFLARHYLTLLKWALSHRKLMVGMSAIIILSMIPLINFVGKDFLPQDDTSQYQITLKAPEGTSLEVMKQLQSHLSIREYETW